MLFARRPIPVLHALGWARREGDGLGARRRTGRRQRPGNRRGRVSTLGQTPQLAVLHFLQDAPRLGRTWYDGDVVTRRHDLNAEGKAIRRLQYDGGKLAVREYFNNQGVRVSRELLKAAGEVTDTIRYADDGREINHWWFDGGWPIKQVRGGREYVKVGERFGRYDNGRFIDLPRGAISE